MRSSRDSSREVPGLRAAGPARAGPRTAAQTIPTRSLQTRVPGRRARRQHGQVREFFRRGASSRQGRRHYARVVEHVPVGPGSGITPGILA